MKTKEEVNVNHRSPFYACLYADLRKAALECGYALALHGSMASDMDLLAVPWVDGAVSPEELFKAIHKAIGSTLWQCDENLKPEEKPHGRIAYAINIFGDVFIDLSIVKPNL